MWQNCIGRVPGTKFASIKENKNPLDTCGKIVPVYQYQELNLRPLQITQIHTHDQKQKNTLPYRIKAANW
jgi:hypothetical protein